VCGRIFVSLIQFFKYTEVTFIGVKGYIYIFCLVQQVLIALRYFASVSFLQVVGDTMGVDKGTVSRCIQRVSHALAAKTDQFIKWPSDQRKRKLSKVFTKVEGFLVSLDV